MNLEHHEEVFRDRLQNHHEPVNTAELWNDIQPFIGSSTKRRRFLPFWWVFGLFLFLGLTAFTLWRSVEKEEKPTPKQPVYVAQNDARPSGSTLSSSTLHSTEASEKTASIRPASVDQQQHVQASTASLNDENETTSTMVDYVSTNTSGGLNKSGDRTSLTDHDASLNATLQTNETQAIPALTSESLEEVYPTYEFAGIVNHPTKPQTNQVVSVLPTTKSVVPVYQADIPSTIILEQATRQNRFHLVAEAGWGRFSSDLAPLADSPPDYAVASDATPGQATKEDALFRAQVGVQYALSPSFYIQSGVGYLELQNQANLDDVLEYQTNDNGLLNTYFTDDLANVNLGSDVEFVSPERQDINHRAKRRYIEVPIKVGYKKALRRFAIGGFVGAAINVPTHKSGTYLGAANRLIPVSEAKTQSVDDSSQIGISYQAGIEAGYQVTSGLEIYLSPFASYLTNMQGLSETTENLTAYGLNVGMRLRI